MKKILSFLILGLFLTSNAFAGTLSLTTYISGNDVTIANLESDNNAIESEFNGNIESVNIKDGTIVTSDMSDAVSSVPRWDEAFNDLTTSGMLPATSADLTSDISAGVSYVDGLRISKTAESHTYTANKDTYVYIHSGGYYVYQEVANGAGAPATPSNTLLLAKVVTDADNITSVDDQRTTAIQITVNSTNFPKHYRKQAYVVRDTTTTVHLEPGYISVGNSIYSNASDTSSKNIATAANWIEGVPSGDLTSGLLTYIYAYNDSGTSFDFKYSSADPVNSEAGTGTGGTLRYYTTGGTDYRAVGWCYVSADAIQTHAISNWADGDVINQVYLEDGSLKTGTGTIPFDDSIPQNTEGNEFMQIGFKPTNVNNKILIEIVPVASSSGDDQLTTALFQDSTANALAAAWGRSEATSVNYPPFAHRLTAGSTSYTTFKVRIAGEGGTTTFNGTGGSRYMGGVSASSIKVTEIPS
jgi:hypothetical protein